MRVELMDSLENSVVMAYKEATSIGQNRRMSFSMNFATDEPTHN